MNHKAPVFVFIADFCKYWIKFINKFKISKSYND